MSALHQEALLEIQHAVAVEAAGHERVEDGAFDAAARDLDVEAQLRCRRRPPELYRKVQASEEWPAKAQEWSEQVQGKIGAADLDVAHASQVVASCCRDSSFARSNIERFNRDVAVSQDQIRLPIERVPTAPGQSTVKARSRFVTGPRVARPETVPSGAREPRPAEREERLRALIDRRVQRSCGTQRADITGVAYLGRRAATPPVESRTGALGGWCRWRVEARAVDRGSRE